MLKRFSIFIFLAVSFSGFSQTETFHDFRVKNIFGDSVNMSDYYGKKVMVVNTASFCQFTPQYEDLENLYAQFRDSNFVIVGFPCNDFNGQEPGGDSAIYQFCVDSFGIQFPMMSKISVKAPNTAEVFKWLQTKSRNGVKDAPILWNFYKFLIDEAGNWVAYHPSSTSPLNQAIIDWIKSPSVLPPDTTSTSVQELLKINGGAPSIKSGKLSASFTNLKNAHTTIGIYSVLGQFVSKVYDGVLQNGEIIHADINSLENGIYFLHVTNGGVARTFKFSLVK